MRVIVGCAAHTRFLFGRGTARAIAVAPRKGLPAGYAHNGQVSQACFGVRFCHLHLPCT